MRIHDLVRRYPRVYHMAETGTWESIRVHGLLSTSALLDLFGYEGTCRAQIESRRRPECVTITHPVYGRAVIRDNKPMHESHLTRCLRDGLTPKDWYKILNGRVFFWVSEARLVRLLCARAYRGKEHLVLTVDTRSLVDSHLAEICLSPINSGCTVPAPQPRGRDTFRRVADYPFDDMVRRRGSGGEPIVELTVDRAVYDIKDHVVKCCTMEQERILETIWER